MRIEQFVMAYGVEQDRLRATLPDGFSSLRPVLRINAEIRGGEGYIELNTAVMAGNFRGWINIWNSPISFVRDGKTVRFENEIIAISFRGVGIEGGCPAEKDNAGCVFPGKKPELCLPDEINERKEFCDCEFEWRIPGGTHGKSVGKTLPAIPTEPEMEYPKAGFNVGSAAVIECRQVLGSYRVGFERDSDGKWRDL